MPVEGFGTVTLDDEWYNSVYVQAEKSHRSMGEQIKHELQRLGYKALSKEQLVEKCKELGVDLPRKYRTKTEVGTP